MKILEKPLLSERTTIRLGGQAIAEVVLENEDDYLLLHETLRSLGGSPYIMGGGSNLLIHDGDLPIVILSTSRSGRSITLVSPPSSHEENVQVHVTAGTPLPQLLSWCSRHGLSGLEGLAGIPGHVGGAIAMNAGAFGSNTDPLLKQLKVYTPERGLHELSHQDDWNYAYRHFSLQQKCAWFLITAADFILKKSSPEAVKNAIKKNLALKIKTQPVQFSTAGCIFKNPVGDHAGRLLDASEVKGLRKGAFYFSQIHANFLVHDVKCGIPGIFDDAMSLILQAQKKVYERFGITLETEVIVWS